ncbi:MAG TPA: hypothetical protein VMD29_11045 [Terracidiphilus sp.]|nr:hypothetical protein [Terracidiphilus sp.]
MEPDKAGLIQRVEDEFQISISEEEMSLVRTAGDLQRLVMSKLVQESLLVPSRALYLVRRALAEVSGASRRIVRPDVALETLVPADDRPAQWNQMVRTAGVRFPRLQHSARWKDRMMLASMAISAVPVLAVWWALYALDWIRGLGILLFSLPAALGFLLLESRVDKHLLETTRGRATELPCETVRELADAVLEANSTTLLSSLGAGQADTGEMVWARITELIRRTGNLEPDRIEPGTVIPELQQVD